MKSNNLVSIFTMFGVGVFLLLSLSFLQNFLFKEPNLLDITYKNFEINYTPKEIVSIAFGESL